MNKSFSIVIDKKIQEKLFGFVFKCKKGYLYLGKIPNKNLNSDNYIYSISFDVDDSYSNWEYN